MKLHQHISAVGDGGMQKLVIWHPADLAGLLARLSCDMGLGAPDYSYSGMGEGQSVWFGEAGDMELLGRKVADLTDGRDAVELRELCHRLVGDAADWTTLLGDEGGAS